MEAQDMGLEGENSQLWSGYIDALNRSKDHLSDMKDNIIRSTNHVGTYKYKWGYKVLSSTNQDAPLPQWGEILWKLKCPPKSNLYMWLLLLNKAPT